jgi:hypothetical protein
MSGNNVEYYLLDNELNPSGGMWFPYCVYYIMDNVSNTSRDYTYGVERYTPNIVYPSYPHENPDTTPGYILKFEGF